jgi:hypothetical protein
MKRSLLGALALLASGCFIGYDSRWGQQKQAQQHLAAARKPTSLGPARAEARLERPEATTRIMRVRLEPTATHAAQVIDCERRFNETLAAANLVLEPALGIHLEVAETRAFKPERGEDHLSQVLEDLRQSDDGEGVEWVIGLTGAVPRFEDSFHELGFGEVVGKFVVLRALNDAAEYDAIRANLSELSESERDELFKVRLRHKVASVLLHEIGHTLGALHEADKTNLMNPRYSQSVQHFGTETLDVMRAVLAHRTASGHLDDAGKQAIVELWRREPAPWIPEERSEEIARFDVHGSSPAAASNNAPPAESGNGSVPNAAELRALGLTSADATAYREATRLLATGDVSAALQTGRPLFDAYPNVAPISELRCNIAMRRGLPWEETRHECAAVMRGAFGGH